MAFESAPRSAKSNLAASRTARPAPSGAAAELAVCTARVAAHGRQTRLRPPGARLIGVPGSFARFYPLLAWAHLRAAGHHGADGPDALQAFGAAAADWSGEVLSFAGQAAATVREDYRAFRKACPVGTLPAHGAAGSGVRSWSLKQDFNQEFWQPARYLTLHFRKGTAGAGQNQCSVGGGPERVPAPAVARVEFQ